MAISADIKIWESAEIERSNVEAAQTPLERLRDDEANVARYLHPPGNTPYPLEYAFHLLGDVAGQTVLDYGCGNGENSILLARKGTRVIGLDVSEALLRLARTRLAINGFDGRAQFLAASAHDLPLPDRSVDVVFGIAILHHLDLDLAAREVARVLKPGGRAIFQEPVRNSHMLRRIRRLIPYRDPEVSDFERQLTDGELRQFGSRFQGFRARGFSLPFINLAQVVPALRAHLLELYKLDGAILRNFPWLDGFTGIRVVEMVKA